MAKKEASKGSGRVSEAVTMRERLPSASTRLTRLALSEAGSKRSGTPSVIRSSARGGRGSSEYVPAAKAPMRLGSAPVVAVTAARSSKVASVRWVLASRLKPATVRS